MGLRWGSAGATAIREIAERVSIATKAVGKIRIPWAMDNFLPDPCQSMLKSTPFH